MAMFVKLYNIINLYNFVKFYKLIKLRHQFIMPPYPHYQKKEKWKSNWIFITYFKFRRRVGGEPNLVGEPA